MDRMVYKVEGARVYDCIFVSETDTTITYKSPYVILKKGDKGVTSLKRNGHDVKFFFDKEKAVKCAVVYQQTYCDLLQKQLDKERALLTKLNNQLPKRVLPFGVIN